MSFNLNKALRSLLQAKSLSHASGFLFATIIGAITCDVWKANKETHTETHAAAQTDAQRITKTGRQEYKHWLSNKDVIMEAGGLSRKGGIYGAL